MSCNEGDCVIRCAPMRNPQFSKPSKGSVAILFLCLSALAAGCGYRDKRDEKKARKAAEISEKIQNESEAQKVEVAKGDLQARISYFQGLEGEYQGRHKYSSSESRNFISRIPEANMSVRVRITATNIPPEYMQTRATRESEVLAQMDAMRLMVDVYEGDTELNLVHVTCNVSDVKPDFSLGIIRFSCPQASGTPARNITLSLDYNSHDEDIYSENWDSLYNEEPLVEIDPNAPAEFSRSSAVATALLKQRIRNVEILNIEAVSPNVTVRGVVYRKSSVR